MRGGCLNDDQSVCVSVRISGDISRAVYKMRSCVLSGSYSARLSTLGIAIAARWRRRDDVGYLQMRP